MPRSLSTIGILLAGALVGCVLLPITGSLSSARAEPFFIVSVDIDVISGQIDPFLTALKENGEATAKEPGCRQFDIAVSQKDPNHVLIFEVYEDAAAAQAHRETDHFKKYWNVTKDMVTKREGRPFSSVAMNMRSK